MKKKIVFMIYSLHIGGVEKSLLSLLKQLKQNDYEITILMLDKSGELLKFVPKNINIKTVQDYQVMQQMLESRPKTIARKMLIEGKVIRASMMMFVRILSKLCKNDLIYYRYLLRPFKALPEKYDVAIAYAGPMDFISYYIADKVTASKKVQWIHSDITKINTNRNFTRSIYKKFDQFFVVSKEANEKLVTFIPSIHAKTAILHNVISKEEMIQKANRNVAYTDVFHGIRILTIGRLSKEKGQDMTIPILARLKKEGYQVKWYCIGEGNARKEYEKLIAQYGLEDDYILLGSKANPYPYLAQCDLYVQPSRYEGFCLSLAEAKIFHKPIVTTNFVGANEQITNGKNGIIVEVKEEEMYQAIKKLIENKQLRLTLTNNLAQTNKVMPNQLQTFLDYVG